VGRLFLNAQEELLDLEKEKIEWVNKSVKKKLKRLRWGSSDSKGGHRQISLRVARPPLFDRGGGSPPPWPKGVASHPLNGQEPPQNFYFF
jgi:hypothetical protein